MARFERKVQQLESGIAFDSKRRYLLLGMRDHILKVNPRVSLGDAYRYAQLALEASEKYPAVDPLLLLAIGTVESGYDPQATSPPTPAASTRSGRPRDGCSCAASAGTTTRRPSTTRRRTRTAAALYLDILFSTYSDPQLVLAEYNGGPLNAGYFRAGVGALAAETRNYVPRVLQLYARLKEQFDKGLEQQVHRDPRREGKTLSPPR